MRKALTAIAVAIAATMAMSFAASAADGKPEAKKADSKQIARGRYLLIVGNCNDCHTAGFGPSDGQVPEKDWLLGSGPLGFRGPWGTTYATNLRLSLSKMTEAEWVKYAKTLKTRPPMPWFNVNQWSEAAPQALSPDKEPKPPFLTFPAPPPKR